MPSEMGLVGAEPISHGALTTEPIRPAPTFAIDVPIPDAMFNAPLRNPVVAAPAASAVAPETDGSTVFGVVTAVLSGGI
jgi:hypothetical protein